MVFDRSDRRIEYLVLPSIVLSDHPQTQFIRGENRFDRISFEQFSEDFRLERILCSDIFDFPLTKNKAELVVVLSENL